MVRNVWRGEEKWGGEDILISTCSWRGGDIERERETRGAGDEVAGGEGREQGWMGRTWRDGVVCYRGEFVGGDHYSGSL